MRYSSAADGRFLLRLISHVDFIFMTIPRCIISRLYGMRVFPLLSFFSSSEETSASVCSVSRPAEKSARMNLPKRIRVRWKTRDTLYRHSLGSLPALPTKTSGFGVIKRDSFGARILENFYCFCKDGARNVSGVNKNGGGKEIEKELYIRERVSSD